jgi:hypothetical protein
MLRRPPTKIELKTDDLKDLDMFLKEQSKKQENKQAMIESRIGLEKQIMGTTPDFSWFNNQ